MSGIVPFERVCRTDNVMSSADSAMSDSSKDAEGLGSIAARALAYGKGVSFVLLRKIRKP